MHVEEDSCTTVEHRKRKVGPRQLISESVSFGAHGSEVRVHDHLVRGTAAGRQHWSGR